MLFRSGKTEFESAIFPKDGLYRIPIKNVLREAEKLELGDEITVKFNLGKR